MLLNSRGKISLFLNIWSPFNTLQNYSFSVEQVMFFQITEVENIGARRLHTVMSKLLNELLFDVPDKIGPNAKIVVTKEMVTEKLASLIKNKDLSHYIL